MSLLIAQAACGWPDLNIVKTGPTQAAPGDLINYTLTYANASSVDGESVVLTDFLPANLTVLTNTLGGGTMAGSIISWNLGTVAAYTGGSRSFQVRVNTNTPASLSLTNRAQIFGSEEEEPGRTNDNYSTLITRIINGPPVAQNDAYTVNEDTALVVPPPGVLANDTDPDGNPLQAMLVSGPTHGTLTLNPNGSFTYTPATNYHGSDTFTYKANDGSADSSVATVTITVTPLNEPPLAVDDNYTLSEDITLLVPMRGVLGNDSDPDGDFFTALLETGPANGVLSLGTNGNFTYQPASNYIGSDSFTYRAFDGQTNSNIATVHLIITPLNDPPVAVNDSYTTPEDTTLNIPAPGVLSNDTDADGDTLTARLEGAPLHGTVTFNQNGSFTYSPAADYYGPDSFTYFASDGRPPVRLATVNLTVLPVNDPPAFTKGADQFLQQNAGPQILPGWATAISSGPANESSQTVSFQVFSDNDALFATQPAVAGDGTLTFTPAANAYGAASVTVIAHDDGGTANGGVDTSAAQTFTIAVNAPPTVSIANPTNGTVFLTPASFNVIADAQDVDGTITNVEIYEGTNKLIEVTAGEMPLIARTNLPVSSYTFSATATDNLGARGTSAPVNITVVERPPLTVLTALHYDPQTDFWVERVRITNPTGSTFDAVRVTIFNLTNTPAITVNNVTEYTNGVPYIQTYAAILPGSYADVTIEYRSPLRIQPNPILRPDLVSPRSPKIDPLVGTPQNLQRGLMFANQTFLVEFASLFNRVYVVQYSSDLLTWKSAEPTVTGTGGWIQWIDNGVPKTDGAPAAQLARFYRVILLP